METDKLLLEIYGKVEATATNVSHILATQRKHEDCVSALHKRVDKHDGYIKWGMGVFAVLGIVAGIIWEWVKAKWRA